MVERFSARPERPESKFKIIIDEQSLAWNKERQLERGDKKRTLYASDYGQCMRKIFFSHFPDEFDQGEFDPRTLRIFHNGEDVHRRLQDYLTKANIAFLEEVDVPRDELNVHGRCDGLAMMHNKFHVLEFKSINSDYVQGPKDEHEGQISWYMHMFELMRQDLREEFSMPDGMSLTQEQLKDTVSSLRRKFDELTVVEKMLLLSESEVQGELIYEAKGTQQIFAFPVQLDAGRFEKIRNWFKEMQQFVDKKERPEVRYDKRKYPCQWKNGSCQFFKECYGEDP